MASIFFPDSSGKNTGCWLLMARHQICADGFGSLQNPLNFLPSFRDRRMAQAARRASNERRYLDMGYNTRFAIVEVLKASERPAGHRSPG
jgi:hypothetical protein